MSGLGDHLDQIEGTAKVQEAGACARGEIESLSGSCPGTPAS